MDKMKTLNKIILGASIIGTLSGCVEAGSDSEVSITIPERDTEMSYPLPQTNQSLILNHHRRTKSGSLKYILLTDMNCDGDWDAMEKAYRTDSIPTVNIYIKKGFSIQQSPPENVNVEFVDSSFFQPYR